MYAKNAGGVRAFILLTVVYGATYTISNPPPLNPFSLLAQVTVPKQIKTPCLKGHEYWIGYQNSNLETIVTKRPPANAQPASLPLGIVRYNDAGGGYVSIQCKENETVGSAIPPGTVISTGSFSPGTLPTPPPAPTNANTQTGAFSSGFSDGDSGASESLVPGGAPQNIPAQNAAPAEGVQLSSDFTPVDQPPIVDEIDRRIQAGAQQSIQSDPKLRDNAFQMRLCQEQGTCEMGTLESSNPLSTEQQLRAQAQQAVRKDYLEAIRNAYGPDYAIKPLGDASVANVYNPDWGARYYDAETGAAFLKSGIGDEMPTILTSSGQAFSTEEPLSGWQRAMENTIDSPSKFNVFESEYFDSGNTPKAYELVTEGAEVVARGECDACSKIVPTDAYAAIRQQGDYVHGVDDIRARISESTYGRVHFDNPDSWPQRLFYETPIPPNALTQVSSADRASAITVIANEIDKYPSEFWENAKAVTIYTYGDSYGSVAKTAGWSAGAEGYIFVNASLNTLDPSFFSTIIDHELAHYNEASLFPSEKIWGTSVYGPQYGYVYAGESGAQSISLSKLGIIHERPEGFADTYGYRGGIHEDQATVVHSMFRNYSAVQTAAQTDPALAVKVDLVKQGYASMSDGVMNDEWWQNLKPTDMRFSLQQPISISEILVRRFGF